MKTKTLTLSNWKSITLILTFLTINLFSGELIARPIATDIFGYPIGQSYQYIGKGKKTSVGPLATFTGYHSRTLKSTPMRLKKAAYQAFTNLRNQARQEGIYLYVSFGYRSLATQRKLYQQFGPRRAEKPGYSEHNIGTAIDLTRVTFQSEAFLWLLKKGFQLGWVPTYYYRSEGNFIREPWHWRYVGSKAAQTFYQHWKKSIERDKQRLTSLKRQGKLAKNRKLK